MLKRIPLFIWTITPEGFGAKLTFAKASGIVTGDAPVSYWPIFPLSPVTVPEVFANATLERRRKLGELTFAKASGIVTGTRRSAIGQFFYYPQSPSQKSLRKLTRPSFLLKWRIATRF